jgi:hypothetical protein
MSVKDILAILMYETWLVFEPNSVFAESSECGEIYMQDVALRAYYHAIFDWHAF